MFGSVFNILMSQNRSIHHPLSINKAFILLFWGNQTSELWSVNFPYYSSHVSIEELPK